MSNLYKYETVRRTSLTEESNIITCHFSNAMSAFKGNSVLVAERINNQEYKYFLKLKNRWKEETMFTSSSTEIFKNSAYKEIISFGSKSIPWIIREMKKTDDHWFYALKEITGANPINPEHYGIINRMKQDWMNWAELNNY